MRQDTSAIEPTINRLLTVSDVAERLSVQARWVYEHVERGDLPRLGKSRRIRFNSTALNTWLKSHLRGFPSDAEADDDRLMTTAELLDYTGFSRSWVYEACRSRGLPHYKLGAHLRFSRPLLDSWLEQVEHIPVSPETTSVAPRRKK